MKQYYLNKMVAISLVLFITLSLSAKSKKQGFFSRLFGKKTKTEQIETPQVEAEVEAEEVENDENTGSDADEISAVPEEDIQPEKTDGLYQAHSSIAKNLEKDPSNPGLMNAKMQIEKNMEKKGLEVPVTDQDESLEDTGESAETIEEVVSTEPENLIENTDTDEAVLNAKEMKTESKETRTQAKLEAQEMRDEAKLESKEIRTEAKEQARELRDEAKLEAKEIRDQAKEEAKENRDDAKQEAKDKRDAAKDK